MFDYDRRPHADLDLDKRMSKAKKIERLIGPQCHRAGMTLLEIGTGSGVIASYFGQHERLEIKATAVDVVDQRVATRGYEFHLVDGTFLPFEDGSFDIVISNHVIEHLGARRDQLTHLAETKRVLASQGVAYLATPNRWTLIEPHYRLPILSWLPSPTRSWYVRALGRADQYDCEPLSVSQLHELFTEVGLACEHLERQAIIDVLSVEREWSRLARLVGALPAPIFSALRPVMPTFVCMLRHSH